MMPANPSTTQTIAVRRPKDRFLEIQEVARRLNTTPAKLHIDALDKLLPQLKRKAGMSG